MVTAIGTTHATEMFRSADVVVAYLQRQHAQIRGMFEDVLALRGRERTKAFLALRSLLAIHEAAEEEIVHPISRLKLTNGNAIVDARLAEEHSAKTTLAALEDLDIDSPEFQATFETLKAAVIAHAGLEEREEFELLRNVLDIHWLARMKVVAEHAEAIAPMRPRPGLESAAANRILGPFLAMVGNARDAIAAKP